MLIILLYTIPELHKLLLTPHLIDLYSVLSDPGLRLPGTRSPIPRPRGRLVGDTSRFIFTFLLYLDFNLTFVESLIDLFSLTPQDPKILYGDRSMLLLFQPSFYII